MLGEIYNLNLEYLRDIDVATYNKIINLDNKSAYVEKSLNGYTNVIKKYYEKEYRVYSKEDPIEMSKYIADNAFSEEADIIFIFGLGLCYELKEMLKKNENRIYIIVEPDEDIFKVMLENINIDFMINSPQDILFYVGKDFKHIMKMFQTIISEMKTLKIKFVISPVYKVVHYSLYKKIVEGLRLEFNRYVVNINSIKSFDKLWYENYIKNLKYLKETCPVKILDGKFKGIPAVICAAGPSISYDIEMLKRIKNNVFIAAVGSGVSVLEANGIRAHVIGAMDGNETEAKIFKNLSTNKDASLFYSLQVNYCVPKETSNCRFIMNQVNMDGYVGEALGWEMYNQFSGSSIANVMADNLAKLGFNPIVLLGQDFCYSRNKNYAEGATFYSSIDSKTLENSPSYVKMQNNKGEDVFTRPNFISMRDVMESIIRNNPKTKFLNGSQEGLKITGAENINFEEYYNKNFYALPEKNFHRLIKELHDKKVHKSSSKASSQNIIQELTRELKNIVLLCEKIVSVARESYEDSLKKSYIDDLEKKLYSIKFYKKVLKFSIDNIEFLVSKAYSERKINIYLYAIDRCREMMKNIDESDEF